MLLLVRIEVPEGNNPDGAAISSLMDLNKLYISGTNVSLL
jgi:hypothetical protein